jgi:protein tyrosine phosphatase (PTP) superfamily phosphohydrolase (DUF442 family)
MRSKVILGLAAAVAMVAAASVLWPVVVATVSATSPATNPATTTATSPTSRPAAWAQPMTLAGVPNLFKVSDDLYRSAQPTKEGLANLKKLGVKTIINCRMLHSERGDVTDLGMAYVSIGALATHAEEEDVVEFLKVVADKSRGPFLVHCQHGADRTGLMIAAYRVAVCGWSKAEAIAELTEGGSGFHEVFQNIIKFVNDMDVVKVRQAAGLPTTSSPATDRS